MELKKYRLISVMVLTAALVACSKSSESQEDAPVAPIVNKGKGPDVLAAFPKQVVLSDSGYKIEVRVGGSQPTSVNSESLSLSGGSNAQ